jgi:hypothetical protein
MQYKSKMLASILKTTKEILLRAICHIILSDKLRSLQESSSLNIASGVKNVPSASKDTSIALSSSRFHRYGNEMTERSDKTTLLPGETLPQRNSTHRSLA